MESRINQTIKYLYILLTTIPIVYLLVAMYSYYSVLWTFGQVPSSEDFMYDLVKNSGKKFKIFPSGPGSILSVGLIFCSAYGVPIVTIVNGLLRVYKESVIFYTWHLLTMILVYGGVWFLLRTEPVGWYFSYVLD